MYNQLIVNRVRWLPLKAFGVMEPANPAVHSHQHRAGLGHDE